MVRDQKRALWYQPLNPHPRKQAKNTLVVVQQLVKPAGLIFIEPIEMLYTWAIDHAAELDSLTVKQAAGAHLVADAPEQTHPPIV